MSAPMNQPPYEAGGEEPFRGPADPTWERTGVYVEPTSIDLGSYTGGHGDIPKPAAPGLALPPLPGQLAEADYAPDRFAASGDVDRHINNDKIRGPDYSELGPRPFPQ